MATKALKQPRLTFHQLIVALSFWGSTTRLLLAGFVVAAIFALKLFYLHTAVSYESQIFIYIAGSIALFDIGYVIIARALPLVRRLDQVAVLVVDALLVFAYVTPNIISAPALGKLASWSIFIVLLALSARALLGLLFSSPKKK